MQRQVAHALLTRPPLSCIDASRRINLNNSVRLECVMHAASVHPEPGSNSREYCILSPEGVKTYSRAFVALLLLLCLSSILNLNCSSLHRTFLCLLCTFLFVVQFSMTVRLRLFLRRLEYYITSNSYCQHFFSFFLHFFAFCIF